MRFSRPSITVVSIVLPVCCAWADAAGPEFVVAQDGTLKESRVIGPCPHEILNAAAQKAIRDAAPFPKPPPRFFKGDVPLQITLAFELTLY